MSAAFSLGRPVARLAAAALVATTLALTGCNGGGGAGSGSRSGAAAEPAEEPHALVANGATLLDVRTPAEYADGHIEGATLIPVSELGGRLDEVPRDRPVVVYCRSGNRSGSAARTLRAAGYEVYDLGPMSAW